MAAQVYIPPDLTDDRKAHSFQYRDGNLNSVILYALLHGIYTGILAVTLWNIFINKRWLIRRALVVVIILLHALTTINFAFSWSYIQYAFIENGQSFWTEYLKLSVAPATALETGITSSASTILADLYMIWCCWMVWGRRWPIVLLPILTLISATVSKIFQIYLVYFSEPYGIFPMLYLSCILATTLWCTLLIIFRILTVTGVRRGVGGRLGGFHRFIGVLVESSALYSISLILSLASYIRNDSRLYYFGVIAGIAKGVAPTLLIGRAAAGHTCPNEEHDKTSLVSAIRFQMSSQPSQPPQSFASSFQESTRHSAVLEMDIEAQLERLDELVVVVERAQ
ncbi:uncharacterized protein EV420DRAFT_1749576 [Desarmillaria tabescens]|uniref:Uncharacterized protein n=1 Tax=Armillaria tabescens TaxID=1929756 RepID=A0AA39K5V0_ARMTA|nr:uncharacterized protein EV420DRAFT_1749576 [Desarmillaria tabescens]KAK0454005.1 hypothetical protein EV420DRAFT_1749576 [Desarmillaria tabescens]